VLWPRHKTIALPEYARFVLTLQHHKKAFMDNTQEREIWGILGGMGPLASAEFVNSIYHETTGGKEQDSPIVILFSDPTVPDRTESLLNGGQQVLLQRLTSGVETLVSMGATSIVICCMTIHPLIPLLPSALRERVVSLLDLTLDAVLRSGLRQLLFCTTGTRKMRLFQQHPLWPKAESMIVLPTDEDQELIHKLLYEIKGRQEIMPYVPLLEELMKKYGVDSYIAGCTEMHIVAKAHEQLRGRDRRSFCIDPLTEILARMHTAQSLSVACR
jgi:aspartate racemase